METIFKQNPKKYLSNPRKKDYYNFINTKLSENEINSVLDIGAASGDFLYYLPNNIKGLGVDINPELVTHANQSRKKKI